MNAFALYLAEQLGTMLLRDRVVVLYDPKEEFSPFFKEMKTLGTGHGELPRVMIHDTMTHLARYDGSLFGLKLAMEPNASLDKPEPMLVYLPGLQRDSRGSILMELEKAGSVLVHDTNWNLKRKAREILRERYSEGEIDDMLAPETLTYHDVVRYLDQKPGGSASALKLVLGDEPSEALIAKWLASDDLDSELEAKLAKEELYKLIAAQLGFELDSETTLIKARRHTLRFVLVNEFRADLTDGSSPDTLAFVPDPDSQKEYKRLRAVAELLREKYAESYIGMADSLEKELKLTKLGLDPIILGKIDTFRFEEHLLLELASHLICDGKHERALGIINERRRSFWVDRCLNRMVQWEVCKLAADLGRAIDLATPKIQSLGNKIQPWIEAYSSQDGIYKVDRTQRTLEARIATMNDEPEDCLDKAIRWVRNAYEEIVESMAQGFTSALVESNWNVQSTLQQTRIYPDVVASVGGRVAYFLVDALRFEMGVDLAEQLPNVEDLKIKPAVAALPSITTIGMAALLPEASSSFSVVDHKGKIAARIEDTILLNVNDRQKLLKALRPGTVDIDLGELLEKSKKGLKQKLGKSPLIIVRTQSIDALGEVDSGMAARQIVNTILGNVARGVRKLAKHGVEHFVITADHGHLFSKRKTNDKIIGKPGGKTVDQHRRCWAGLGGKTPAACVRVSGAELGYTTDLDFIFPKGLSVFKSGGALSYHHGGISLQEMVIPVLSFRIPGSEPQKKDLKVHLEGCPDVVTNRAFAISLFIEAEMFEDVVPIRLVLLEKNQVVGHAGMAPGAAIDASTGTVKAPSNKNVDIAMMLSRENSETVRIVALDPETDEMLAQSDEIPVKLGI